MKKRADKVQITDLIWIKRTIKIIGQTITPQFEIIGPTVTAEIFLEQKLLETCTGRLLSDNLKF